jgi:hypothetical protein
VPVKSEHFDRHIFIGSEFSLERHDHHYAGNYEPDDHMERMHAGHDEIHDEKELNLGGIVNGKIDVVRIRIPPRARY